MAPEPPVLVIGATGKVGGSAVAALLGAGRPVRALTRRPEQAGLPEGAEIVAGGPESPQALAAAFDGVPVALVVLAGDVPAQAANVAAAAATAGTRRLAFVSSIAVTHPVDHPNRSKHRQAEQAFLGGPVPTVFLRPGPFHSNALWWAGSIRDEGRAVSLLANYPVATIDPADVAAAGLAALGPEREPQEAYALTGPEAQTPERQVAILAELLGTAIEFEAPGEAAATELYGQMTGKPETAAANVHALHDPASPWTRPTDSVLRLTGSAPREFRAWAELNLDRFR